MGGRRGGGTRFCGARQSAPAAHVLKPVPSCEVRRALSVSKPRVYFPHRAARTGNLKNRNLNGEVVSSQLHDPAEDEDDDDDEGDDVGAYEEEGDEEEEEEEEEEAGEMDEGEDE